MDDRPPVGIPANQAAVWRRDRLRQAAGDYDRASSAGLQPIVPLPPVSASLTDEALNWVDRQRCRVPCELLATGLYLVELDRPWLDTPFALEGFAIGGDDELHSLRQTCDFAYVDLDRSAPDAAAALLEALRESQPAAGRHPVPPSPTGLRADLRISAATRQRFRQFAREAQPLHEPGLLKRVRAWFAGPLASASMARHSDHGIARHAHRGLLPADVEPTPHRTVRTVDQEMSRARRAFAFAEQALSGLQSDVRHGRPLDLGTLTPAAYAMADSLIDQPDALLWIGRTRDREFNPHNHGVKVAVYLIALGRHLGLPRRHLAELGLLGLLADLGKVRVPQALLDKPGMLGSQEFAQIKEHVQYSLEALSQCASLPDSVELGIAQHHERLDGSGYPNGLAGDEISLYGRMAAIADSFTALISPRAYAAAASPQDALMNLCEWAGRSFDEPLVEQFVQAVGLFPVGGLVELSNGEVARVLTAARERRAHTRVLVLTESDKSPLATPRERLIGGMPTADAGHEVRIISGLPAGAYGLQADDPYAHGRVEPATPLRTT